MDTFQGIDSPKLDCSGTEHLPRETQVPLTSPNQQPVIMDSPIKPTVPLTPQATSTVPLVPQATSSVPMTSPTQLPLHWSGLLRKPPVGMADYSTTQPQFNKRVRALASHSRAFYALHASANGVNCTVRGIEIASASSVACASSFPSASKIASASITASASKTASASNIASASKIVDTNKSQVR